jgi:hypothetical protein
VPRVAARRLVLQRVRSTDQGTAGALLRADGTRLAWTMELPWRENRPRVSSIPPGLPPPGEYVCRMCRSPKFGPVYEVTGVPGRSSILIHTGNWAGDVSRGYRSHVLGCVVLGLYRGRREGQLAVMVSRPAVTRLEREMQRQPFTLEIRPSWASSTSSAQS